MADLGDGVVEVLVPREFAGLRFDVAAAKLFDDYSRALLTQWIKAGQLRLNGQIVRPRTSLIGGERLSLSATHTAPTVTDRVPQAVDFDVVFEDSDIAVIDKPAGLVVHPGAGNPDGTLANGILHRWPQLAGLPRLGIVHRLDKDTTGLMVVALSHRAHKSLTQQLKDREMARRYLAVVEGVLVSGREIDAPIGRHPVQRTKQAIRADGRHASTKVRVQTRFRAHTLVKASLATGRTHQIRVHLSSIGYPLVGDRQYGARNRLPANPTESLTAAVQRFGRQALLAQELALDHPATGERCEFSVGLPPDMTHLIYALEADAHRDGGVLE